MEVAGLAVVAMEVVETAAEGSVEADWAVEEVAAVAAAGWVAAAMVAVGWAEAGMVAVGWVEVDWAAVAAVG